MANKLHDFIELSKSIEHLWAAYNGSNRKLDNKYKELDTLIENLQENNEDLIEIENYVNSKYDNYFEKLLFSRYYCKTNVEKYKALLEYVEENADSHAKFLANSALIFLKNSKV